MHHLGLRSLRFSLPAFGVLAWLALPGVAAATTTIAGGNVGDQTWAAADGPFIIQGDVTVPAGATLTIQGGTVVRFASNDMQGSGASTSLVELIVHGTLMVNGDYGQPVTFEAQAGSNAGTWYGIAISDMAARAIISGAVVRHAVTGISSAMTATPLAIQKSVVELSSTTGIAILAGIATIDASVVRNGANAIGVDVQPAAGRYNFTNLLVTGNRVGFQLGTPASGDVREIINCTIDHNSTAGISILPGSTIAAANLTANLTALNDIITNNGVGVLRPSSSMALQVNLTYSDIWNNSTDTSGASPGAGCLGANPQFVSASDWHLQSSSVCIDSGGPTGATLHDLDWTTSRPLDGDGTADTDGSEVDMGAYELVRGSGAGGSSGTGGSGGGAVPGSGGSIAGSGGMTGGSGGRSGSGTDASTDAQAAASASGGGGGCGCDAGGGSFGAPSAAVAALLFGTIVLGRRRRKKASMRARRSAQLSDRL